MGYNKHLKLTCCFWPDHLTPLLAPAGLEQVSDTLAFGAHEVAGRIFETTAASLMPAMQGHRAL